MDLMKFRREIGHANPDLLQLLDFLRSMSSVQETVVRTALTCDTVSPWGDNNNAQLERHSIGVYPGE